MFIYTDKLSYDLPSDTFNNLEKETMHVNLREVVHISYTDNDTIVTFHMKNGKELYTTSSDDFTKSLLEKMSSL